jgi:AhpD family alkylhydroperoxidase
MSRFPLHTIDTAPADSRAALEGLREELKFLPNLAATMGGSPALIEGFTTLRRILGHGSFTAVERETIALSVSFANDSVYPMAAHSTFARMAGISEPDLAALRGGGIPPDERLAALATYTRLVIATRGYAGGEETQRFLDAGFTPAHALSVIAAIAWMTLSNYTHNLTGCALDQPFQPQAWTSPASSRRSA